MSHRENDLKLLREQIKSVGTKVAELWREVDMLRTRANQLVHRGDATADALSLAEAELESARKQLEEIEEELAKEAAGGQGT